MFDKFTKKLKVKMQILKSGVYLNIESPNLKTYIDYVLYGLPSELIKGIELVEKRNGVTIQPHQIVLTPTMNVMDIRRQIGLFIFDHKRWSKQEDIASELLTQNKIDIEMFYRIYQKRNHLELYRKINADVFAVTYGNDSIQLNETAHAINSFYIKEFTESNFSKQKDLNDLISSNYHDPSSVDEET